MVLGTGSHSVNVHCHDAVTTGGLQIQLMAAHLPVLHASADDLQHHGDLLSATTAGLVFCRAKIS